MDGWLATHHLKKLTSYEMLHRAMDLGRYFDRCIPRFTELLCRFGIRENFQSSGRNTLLYMFKKSDTTD
jgi:hypothetical protein